MTLIITGDYDKLIKEEDDYKNKKIAEYKRIRAHAKIGGAVTLSFCLIVALFIVAFAINATQPNFSEPVRTSAVIEGVFVSIYCALLVTICGVICFVIVRVCFSDAFMKDTDIEEVAEFYTKTHFKERPAIFRALMNNQVLSATVVSFDSDKYNTGHPVISLDFECTDTDEKVRNVILHSRATRTSNIDGQDKLFLNMETGDSVVYYADTFSEGQKLDLYTK